MATDYSRDSMIDKVRYGELTPDQAEAEAARLGIGKLAAKPDVSKFDPMKEPWWTLPMAVAWIAWRSPSAVREWWDPYRSECWNWHFKEWRVGVDGPVHAGHFLERRRPATLSGLSSAECYDSAHGLLPSGAISVKDAKAKLSATLGDNAFQATGISTDTGERVVIPDYAWRDLIDVEERGKDVLRVRLGRRGYDEIALRRQNIMAIWQPHRLEERELRLPPLVKPEGPGYMPLYCAAQWIATQGGAIEFEPNDLKIWREAFATLLARI